VTAVVVTWAVAVAGIGYAIGLARAAGRGRWPAHRTAAWYGGLVVAGAGSTLSGSGGAVPHAVGHLLLGMLAPLLLVLSAPVTLALRALPAERARLLSAVLRSRPARVLTDPAVAATLDVGGLWVLYTTDLHTVPATQVHVLAAGYLFTAAVVGVDPAPHRPRPAYRAVVLILAAAVHGLLAKHLYATGWQTGGMVMYYGGDVVEVALAALLCRQWLASSVPRRRAAGRPQGSEVEQREDAADHGDEPDAANGGEDREGDHDHGQHEESHPDAGRHRSGERTHAGHAPIPAGGPGRPGRS
jgi:putative membrane protein